VTPSTFQQGAGLVCYYNSTKFHFLQISADDDGERRVQVVTAHPDDGECTIIEQPAAIPAGPVALRVEVDHEVARFGYRAQGAADWLWLDQSFNASILSDEATLPGLPNFTGAFVGMACYDLSGTKMPADFSYFHYIERE
jgi:xylan 1,4-beta-xylosidase